jgi:sulfite exporter TauE/SafE
MPLEALRRTSFSPAMAISSFGLSTVPPIMINGDILGFVNLATSLASSSAYKNIFTIYFTRKEL